MSEATQRGDVVGAPDASEVTVVVRRARTSDVDAIRRLVQVYAERRILLAKDSVAYYESVQQFRVAETDGVVVRPERRLPVDGLGQGGGGVC